MQIKNKDNPGFTIIELLLGLIITSVVLLCVGNCLRLAIKLSRLAESNSRVYNEPLRALTFMAWEFENMRSFNFSNFDAEKSNFIGEKDRVVFITGKDDGLKVISYYLTDEKNKTSDFYNLVREEQDFKDFMSDEKGELRILAKNIRVNGLKFSYQGKTGANDLPISMQIEICLGVNKTRNNICFKKVVNLFLAEY